MRRIIDDWGLRYPGVEHVEHIYFYEVAIAQPDRLNAYLRRACDLGRDYAVIGTNAPPPPAPPAPVVTGGA